MRRSARTDSNQAEIVKALRNAGAEVYHIHTIKNYADLIVYYNNKTYTVEVKDGSKPPSSRKLTEGELKAKEKIESTGVRYWVINSVQEALDMLNEQPYITIK